MFPEAARRLLFLLKLLPGSVRPLHDHAVQQFLQVVPESRDVFLPQRVLLRLLLRGQSPGLPLAGQFVDAFNLFLFHAFPPGGNVS